jgi:hypothetical protein
MEIANKFINELRGILSYIYLLQSSIDHLAMQQPLEEEIVVYRGLHGIDPGLASCYRSVNGNVILWRSFTSTSRNLELTIRKFVRNEKGLLFEIHLHRGNIVANLSRYSAFNEFEMLIPAYTAFRVDDVVDFHVHDAIQTVQQNTIVPLVKLSYAFSWHDFALDS